MGGSVLFLAFLRPRAHPYPLQIGSALTGWRRESVWASSKSLRPRGVRHTVSTAPLEGNQSTRCPPGGAREGIVWEARLRAHGFPRAAMKLDQVGRTGGGRGPANTSGL